ncbi:MAG: alpha-L-fucosidase [Acidobacteriota bacterium]|nr:alpha-L-fucosidase [Acidobacteriota bacterium]
MTRKSFLRLSIWLLPLGAATHRPVLAVAQSAPTAILSAAAQDEQWAKGSARYDARRTEILKHVDRVTAAGPFTPDWQTLGAYSEPAWYKDAKFGIFIHWGVYSVPAFGSEWYPRNMYIEGTEENKHHVATYGPLTSFGYKDFIPMFRAEKYDPVAWAHLFAQSGARYVVPVFEHHDGFTMYDSSLSDWTAVKMGPHRDLVGELAKAVRAEGLRLGASSHRVEHDWFFDHGRTLSSDVNDPRFASFYGPAHRRLETGNDDLNVDWTFASSAYLEDWLARSAEIVDKYHPDLMYFDWWIGQPSVRPYLARFAAFYYDETTGRGTQGVINYKFNAMREGSGTLDFERGQLENTRTLYWQTDTSVSNRSWGYIEHDSFKTPEFVVHQLVDIVSKNGNLLLNIGPRADGTIPDEIKEVLLSVGAWLKVNGEAIYGTRPWMVYGEGPTRVAGGSFHDVDTKGFTPQDFRFTVNGPVLYATELAWPADGRAVIRSLSRQTGRAAVSGVTLLGSTSPIPFEQREDGLYLRLPAAPPTGFASCFRIEFGPNSAKVR